MDLPTCPSCGQSVLDDDLDDCPFCGASLSGKPAARPEPAGAASPAAAPAAARAKQKVRAATTAPARAKAPAADAAPSEDDPFALERATTSRRKVVPLKPKAEAGRRYPVRCPMCETVGYMARKGAGMDVKCANPTCKFPIFTAPVIEGSGEEDEAAEAAKDESWKQHLTPKKMAAGGAGVIALGLLLFWMFKGKDTSPTTPNGDIVVGPGPRKTNGPVKNGIRNNGVVKIKRRLTLREELQKARETALRRLRGNAEAEGHTQLTKVIARHLATDAYARAGDIKTAEELFTTLKSVTEAAGGYHYQVPSLVSLAAAYRWRGGSGDDKTAAAKLEEARQIVARLKSGVGRPRYDVATLLAAELVATGKTDDARSLIGIVNPESENRDTALELESLVLTTAKSIEQDNVAAAMANRRFRRPKSPPAVAVTYLLAAQGHWKAASDWAKSRTGSDRADCLTAIAEASIALTPTVRAGELPAALQALAKPLSGVDLAIFHARVAVRYRDAARMNAATEANNRKHAMAAMKAAQSLLAKVDRPEPVTKLSLNDVIEYRPLSESERAKWLSLAAAHMELAHAEFLLDPKDTGKQSLAKAQDYMRSLGPSPPMVAPLKDMRQNDPVFPRNFRSLAELAEQRFQRQADALEQALDWNWPRATEAVWDFVKHTDEKTAEKWFSTRVPLRLLMMLVGQQQTDVFNAIKAKVKVQNPGPQAEYLRQVELKLKGGEYRDAGNYFRTHGVDASWRRLFALSIAARLQNDRKLDAAHDFCRGLGVAPALQMDAFELFGALAVHQYGPFDAWKKLDAKAYSPTENAAMSYGYARTIKIPAEKKPAKKQTAAK